MPTDTTHPYTNELLEARRLELGLTMRQLADRAGMAESNVHRALRKPTSSVVADRLIAAMGGLRHTDGALVWGEPAGGG